MQSIICLPIYSFLICVSYTPLNKHKSTSHLRLSYQKAILAGINDGGGHLGSSSQSSSRESKLAALPSDEKPEGDKLSGG